MRPASVQDGDRSTRLRLAHTLAHFSVHRSASARPRARQSAQSARIRWLCHIETATACARRTPDASLRTPCAEHWSGLGSQGSAPSCSGGASSVSPSLCACASFLNAWRAGEPEAAIHTVGLLSRHPPAVPLVHASSAREVKLGLAHPAVVGLRGGALFRSSYTTPRTGVNCGSAPSRPVIRLVALRNHCCREPQANICLSSKPQIHCMICLVKCVYI